MKHVKHVKYVHPADQYIKHTLIILHLAEKLC